MRKRILGVTFLFGMLGLFAFFTGCEPPNTTFTPSNPTPTVALTSTRTATFTSTPTHGSPTTTATSGSPTTTPTVCATNNIGWTPVATMPVSRDRFGAAAVGNIIYAIGGENGNMTTVESYNTGTNTWTTGLSAMPTGRYNLGVAQVNGIIYAIGGNGTSGVVGTVEAYDPGSDSWNTSLTAMPNPRSNFGTAVVNGIIYTIGGDDASANPVTNVDSYNPATDKWTTGLAAFPTALSQFQIGVVNGIIYVAGGEPTTGYTASLGIVNTVESYNPVSNSWTTGLATMPDSISLAMADSYNGLFYVVGGVDNGPYPGTLNTAYAYNPAMNSWSTKNLMATLTFGNAGVIVNGVIYSTGGWSGSAFLNNTNAGVLACQ